MRRRRPPPDEQRIHPAAGIKPEDEMTGQTGSGQARLTLGGSMRRCPRDWNGDPAERFASGSARQVIDRVQQGRLQRSSLFLVHALLRRPLLLHP